MLSLAYGASGAQKTGDKREEQFMWQQRGEVRKLRRVHLVMTRGSARSARRVGGEPDARRKGLMVSDDGAATAEYAIVTLAAVAFAGLLVAILRSEEVRGMLLDLVQRALSFGG